MKDDSEQVPPADDPARAEAMQLMELIRFLARTLGFNNAKLSRRAKVPLATLVRYFKGEGEPKVEFLLSLVRALGLDIREFFEMAYPPPSEPSAARLKLERILRQIQPGRLVEAPPAPRPEAQDAPSLRREDVERMMDDLRRDMRELIGGGPREDPPAAKRKKSGAD